VPTSVVSSLVMAVHLGRSFRLERGGNTLLPGRNNPNDGLWHHQSHAGSGPSCTLLSNAKGSGAWAQALRGRGVSLGALTQVDLVRTPAMPVVRRFALAARQPGTMGRCAAGLTEHSGDPQRVV
jgi:hypothetical protein